MARTPLILVADDDETVARTTTTFLAKQGFRVTDPVVDVNELGNRLSHDNPDLAFLDVVWNRTDILFLLKGYRIAYPRIPLVMHSGFPTPWIVESTVTFGAKGFVAKGDFADLKEAVERVLSGRIYFSHSLRADPGHPGARLGGDLLRKVHCGNPGEAWYEASVSWLSMIGELSPRQAEVCIGLMDGYTVPQLVKRLPCAAGTIRTHLSRVFDKINPLMWPRTEGGASGYAERILKLRPPGWEGPSVSLGRGRGQGA